MVTVLIADDEVLELQYLCRLFEDTPGYRLVGQAENGTQVVELARLYSPDVIILDVNMPTSGLEAAAQIRKDNPDQIIILNTAYADFEYAKRAVDLRLDAYLLKPASAEEVLSTVTECLRQKERESVYQNCSNMKPMIYTEHDAIATACRYIHNHFSEEITLAQMAELVHFSRGYFSRLFRKTTGTTLSAYVNAVRVGNAYERLVNSNTNIADIAMQCGFGNLAHFHRVFKENTGATPRQIRGSYRASEVNRED